MLGESLLTKILMSLCVAGGGVVGMYFVQKAMEPSTVRDILKKEGQKIISESPRHVTETEEKAYGELIDLVELMGKKDSNVTNMLEEFIDIVKTEHKTIEEIKKQKINMVAKKCKFSLGTMEDSKDFEDEKDLSRLFCTTYLKVEYYKKD